jgi:hypothetical protein
MVVRDLGAALALLCPDSLDEAAGVRLRRAPLTPERLKPALA